MMYLTPEQAAARLRDRYGIESKPYIGDLIAASDMLEDQAPFKDSKILEDPPDALLDWVSLYAHAIKEDEPGAVMSDSMAPFSRTFARPEMTQSGKRLARLIAPYIRRTGRVA